LFVDANSAVINFTLVFAADYATLYGVTAPQQGAFRAAFEAAVVAAAENATVQIDSVVPGSVRVTARVAFAPATSGLLSGYSCAVGSQSPCGALLATLQGSPGALFSTVPLFNGVAVTTQNHSTSFLGASTFTPTTPPPTTPAPPPPAAVSSSSTLPVVVGAVVGAGIIGPGTILSVMLIFFKPLLRRLLLKYGFKRLADCVVPDTQGDVAMLKVKLAELQALMKKEVKKLLYYCFTTASLLPAVLYCRQRRRST
jgi:hypothetical protein